MSGAVSHSMALGCVGSNLLEEYVKRKEDVSLIHPLSFVGVKGFEPSTPCSQSRCANRTALRPEDVFLKRDAKVYLLFFICKYLGNFFFKKSDFFCFSS